MSLSVVVPCRNGAPFLAEALASVHAQTRQPSELLVVDDASTDGSAAMAGALGATVIALRGASGNGAARNAGIRAARGALIALLDADDVWLPDHCARVAGLLDEHPSAGAAFSAMQVFGDRTGVHTPRIPEGGPHWMFDDCLRHYVGQPSSCVLRRDAALGVGGFSESMPVGVDFDMWLRLSARHPFVATHAVTARYRAHAGQISARVALQTEMCFRARHAAWSTLRDAGDTTAAARAATIVAEAFDEALREAWESRDLARLDAALALHALVPGSDAVHRRWARRAALPAPLLAAWFRMPRALSDPARRVVQWLESKTIAPR